MGNFSVAASEETIARGRKLLADYCESKETQEKTLLRIFDIAEKEKVKGTHPALEPQLQKVEVTIDTLIKQINGIVAGQDSEIEEQKEKVEAALAEKHEVMAKAEAMIAEAKEREEEAQESITKAEAQIKEAQEQAKTAIKTAEAERDKAILERDKAQAEADDKAKSNDFLMAQMTAIKEEVEACKAVKAERDQLIAELAVAKEQIAAEKLELIKTQEYTDRLQAEYDQRIEVIKAQAEAEKIKAVTEIERNLHALEIENLRLKTQLEKIQNK